ncbi:hypothetical protein HK100_006706 [Physocladia obscura]|uniref:Uncharacterized protein n=1 Tax=Physocladia obscura TaxID=109957 RepID=A0AAD5SQ79_9FUNG|nr:hypothetical protein HK100_006706 [Physocladia obscura]
MRGSYPVLNADIFVRHSVILASAMAAHIKFRFLVVVGNLRFHWNAKALHWKLMVHTKLKFAIETSVVHINVKWLVVIPKDAMIVLRALVLKNLPVHVEAKLYIHLFLAVPLPHGATVLVDFLFLADICRTVPIHAIQQVNHARNA